MPNWFDENGITDYAPYEAGGYAGDAAQGVPQAPAEAQVPQSAAPAAAAFDPYQQVGHNGSINGMNREQYRDAWMSSGVNSVQGAKDWIAKNGGQWLADNGTIMTPFGESLDMGGNARGSAAGRGQLSTQWGGAGGGPAGPGEQGGGTYPGGAFGGGYGGGGGYWGGGGGGAAMPSRQGGAFSYDPISGAPTYTPTAVGGPEAWSGQTVTAPEALTLEQLKAADPFKVTTAEDLQNDPGAQYRQRNTLAAMQGSAAARGLLRTGGTMVDLGTKAGELSSEEFANVDARRFRDYSTALQDRYNVGTANNSAAAQSYGLSNQYRQQAESANAGNSLAAWQAYQGMNQQAHQFNAARTDTAAQQNFANRFTVDQANRGNSLAAWQANSGADLGWAANALGNKQADNSYGVGMANVGLGYHSADQSYDLGLKNNALGYTQAGNSFALGMGQQNLGWANYGLNAQGQQFNQGFSLANMGLQAAGMQGGYANNYGVNSGNNATGAGNAAAAGTVGSANAWNAGITGAGNSAMDAYAAWQRGQKP